MRLMVTCLESWHHVFDQYAQASDTFNKNQGGKSSAPPFHVGDAERSKELT